MRTGPEIFIPSASRRIASRRFNSHVHTWVVGVPVASATLPAKSGLVSATDSAEAAGECIADGLPSLHSLSPLHLAHRFLARRPLAHRLLAHRPLARLAKRCNAGPSTDYALRPSRDRRLSDAPASAMGSSQSKNASPSGVEKSQLVTVEKGSLVTVE